MSILRNPDHWDDKTQEIVVYIVTAVGITVFVVLSFAFLIWWEFFR